MQNKNPLHHRTIIITDGKLDTLFELTTSFLNYKIYHRIYMKGKEIGLELLGEHDKMLKWYDDVYRHEQTDDKYIDKEYRR